MMMMMMMMMDWLWMIIPSKQNWFLQFYTFFTFFHRKKLSNSHFNSGHAGYPKAALAELQPTEATLCFLGWWLAFQMKAKRIGDCLKPGNLYLFEGHQFDQLRFRLHFLKVRWWFQLPNRGTKHIHYQWHFWVDDVPNFPFGGICYLQFPWRVLCLIWGVPEMVVPNNHGFSY